MWISLWQKGNTPGGRTWGFSHIPAKTIISEFVGADHELLADVAPLGWEHISLTGDYVWRQNRLGEKRRIHEAGLPEIPGALKYAVVREMDFTANDEP